MGRNQYGITDDDLNDHRDYAMRKASLTPEERTAEETKEKEVRAKEELAHKENKKKIKQEKERIAAEQHKSDNEFFKKMGLEKREPIDPHFSMSHWEYLQTPLWRKIRRRVLKRDGSQCQICSTPAKEVHHRSYEYDVIIGKDDAGCISLCSKCHKLVEFTSDGRHRSVEEKEVYLDSLIHKDRSQTNSDK